MKTDEDWTFFETEVAIQLAKHPFLKWRNRKTHRLVKKLYNLGHTVDYTVNLIILNS